MRFFCAGRTKVGAGGLIQNARRALLRWPGEWRIKRGDQLQQQICCAGQRHDEDGAELRSVQQQKTACEDHDQPPVRARERHSLVPERGDENADACRGDRRHDGRAQRGEHALQQRKFAVAQIQPCQQRHQHARRQHAPHRRSQRTRKPRHAQPDERRRVDGDRPRRHLRDGDKVGEFRHTEPAVLRDDLCLDERHGRVTAAEAEQADLQKAPEQLQQDHPAFLLPSSVRAVPSAMQPSTI